MRPYPNRNNEVLFNRLSITMNLTLLLTSSPDVNLSYLASSSGSAAIIDEKRTKQRKIIFLKLIYLKDVIKKYDIKRKKPKVEKVSKILIPA